MPRTPRSSGRSRSTARLLLPLGSLTQREDRPSAPCRSCGSERTTRLRMRLTDGTPVDFTSCHVCEQRSWEHEGEQLPVASVLDRTRKQV